MQFRVPQNIAMEDRIVGPLSPIQFGIVVIGGGISFFVYSSHSIPSPLNVFFGIMLGLFTIVMAVGKFNGFPMYHFIRFLIAFLIKPKVRIWHKEGAEVKLIKADTIKPEENHHHATKNISKADIARLAEVLDSHGKRGLVPQIKKPDEDAS
ncbi:MAG: PrgI family protein [bacterium]